MIDERKMIYGFVQERLRELKDIPDESTVRAKLAKMRRGIGEQLGPALNCGEFCFRIFQNHWKEMEISQGEQKWQFTWH